MLRLAFLLLTLSAITLSIAVALYGLDLLSTLGIASRDTMITSLACVLAVMIPRWLMLAWFFKYARSE
jgi:hypothetical protein